MEELSDKNRPQKLEDIFRVGMKEAEVTPSERLWDRIEQGLEAKNEATYYKKRLIWFQRLAAACVVLVLLAGGYLLYDYQVIAELQVANKEKAPEQETAANIIAGIQSEEKQKPESLTKQPAAAETKADAGTLAINNSEIKSGKYLVSAETKSGTKKQKNKYARTDANPAATNLAAVDSKLNDELTFLEPILVELEKNNEPGLALMKVPLTGNPAANDLTLQSSKSATKELFTGAIKNISPDSGTHKENTVLTYAAEPGVFSAEQEVKTKAVRWSFSGKYASHYFNQNIALAGNQAAAIPSGFQSNSNVLLTNTSNASFSEALNEYDNNTLPSYSFSTAIGAAYQLNQHWALETGIDYTQNVAGTKSSYIFNNAQMATQYNKATLADATSKNFVIVPTTAFAASMSGSLSAGNAGVVKTQTFNTQYRYRLIGIPLKLNYKTAGNKSFYYASVGFLTNLLMQAHILSESSVVPDLKYAPNAESPFRKWQLATVATFGKGFKINRNFQLRAGLEASQYLTSLAAYPQYLEGKHGKPYTIGLSVSSSYSLSK